MKTSLLKIALGMDCLVCGAKPGQACMSPPFGWCGTHPDRLDHAKYLFYKEEKGFTHRWYPERIPHPLKDRINA